MKKPIENDEINEAFDNIFLAEENILQEGYTKGLEEGQQQGNTEAYHLGYHRGAEIGAELGFYVGVVKFYKQQSVEQTKLPDKINQLLTTLEDRIEKFPKFNDPNIDLFQTITEIRSQYRRLCSTLKIKCTYPEASKLSF